MSHDAEMVQLSNSQRKKLAAQRFNARRPYLVVRCPHCKKTFEPDPAKTNRTCDAYETPCYFCGKVLNFRIFK